MATATEEKGSAVDLKEKTDKELNELTVTVLESEEKAEEIVVTDEASYGLAASMLTTIKGLWNKLEKKRKEYVQPLNDTVKKINDDFKGHKVPLEQAETALKSKMKTYIDEEERKAKAEERRLLAEQEEERVAEEKRQKEERDRAAANNDIIPRQEPVLPKPIPVIHRPPVAVRTSGGGAVNVPKVWEATVLDEALVPRAYCVVSQTLINNAMRAGQRNIPGVKIEQVNQIRGRAGTGR